jgi:hypothetical protein
MSHDQTDHEAAELLRALGRIERPAPSVLDGAREVLWSALADEALVRDVLADGRTGEQAPLFEPAEAAVLRRQRELDGARAAKRRREAGPG